LNSFNITDDHRMVTCKLKLHTRFGRMKLIRGKPPILDMENLGKHRQTFEIELRNIFGALEELEDKVKKTSIAEIKY